MRKGFETNLATLAAVFACVLHAVRFERFLGETLAAPLPRRSAPHAPPDATKSSPSL